MLRPARVLLGWMPPEQALLVQAARDAGATQDPELAERARAAREAVARRSEGLDQDAVIADAPGEIKDHLAALSSNEASASMLREGWRVVVADISRVAALQPNVFTDTAEERVLEADPEDVAGLAAITLPLPVEQQLPIQFDQKQQAWLVGSENPNLRVVGNFTGQPVPGAQGLGFLVAVTPSFVQVASFRGRLILRDGYHRAHGLLQRGISRIPVFFREFETVEQLGIPSGMLPQDAYLGTRPATMLDYMADDVAAEVQLPSATKMLIIQALEVTPLA